MSNSGIEADQHAGGVLDDRPEKDRAMSEELIAAELTEAQRRAVIYCERDGNGRYAYQLHSLAQKGLMALTPVERLQGVSAYRLTPLGRAVREILIRESQS